MKIHNRTHWRSDHIRAIALRVARDELDPGATKGFTVDVNYGGRGPGVSGHAPYHGRRISIHVSSVAIDRVDLAQTIAHEMAHTRGMTHRQMRNAPRYRRMGEVTRALYAWAEDMPLERIVPPKAVGLDERRQKKLDHARALVAQWERRLKRAQGKVRRWKGRVRDYERYIAIAAQRPGPKA